MRIRLVAAFVAIVALCAAPVRAQQAPPSAAQHAHGRPFVVEYYYKAKWGFMGEFIGLFKKNYYPVLAEMKKDGRILEILADAPRYHATEDCRWDFRVAVVWRDVVTAHENHHPEEIVKRLFPDQETYKKEEQRRFEILLAHWDVAVEQQELEPPPPSGTP